ncbi:MAG: ferritin-like domain-containing protein [Polyangiales bacterium]
MSNDELSRRETLSGGAALLAGVGAALAVSAVTRDAEAQSAADVMVLNALLRAEYEAQQAYDSAIGYFGSPAMDDPARSLGAAAGLVATHYRSQHLDHGMRLARLITSLQGTPISQSSVIFTPPTAMGFTRTVQNYLRLACNAEKAAAIAYTNALKSLTNVTAAELAAAIGGVETQHFIVIYLLLKNVATPGMAAATMASELSPRSFVAITGETTDLSSVPDFAFVALPMA